LILSHSPHLKWNPNSLLRCLSPPPSNTDCGLSAAMEPSLSSHDTTIMKCTNSIDVDWEKYEFVILFAISSFSTVFARSRVRVNRARRKSSLIPDLIYIFIYWFQSITLVLNLITYFFVTQILCYFLKKFKINSLDFVLFHLK
jgi:hypothetical protein